VRIKDTAYARAARAQAIARDSSIHAAVSASNASVESPDLVHRRDALWSANLRDPLRQAIVQAPCSAKVREMVKDDPLVVEAFVMNDRGTLVCSMIETSDYWQGDESKWQRTFRRRQGSVRRGARLRRQQRQIRDPGERAHRRSGHAHRRRDPDPQAQPPGRHRHHPLTTPNLRYRRGRIPSAFR
jgi:hypothetical protein